MDNVAFRRKSQLANLLVMTAFALLLANAIVRFVVAMGVGSSLAVPSAGE